MSFTVENLEEKNMVKLVIESTAEEFEAGLNTAYNKNKSKISLPGFRKGMVPGATHDGKYLVDIDLSSGWGGTLEDFRAKGELVANEFEWVGHDGYLKKRLEILLSFAKLPLPNLAFLTSESR